MGAMRPRLTQLMNRIGQCGRAISQEKRGPAVLLTFLILFTTVAFGQLTTADILGTVTDASGAVIPNATVTLTNLGTNETRVAQTGSSGDYTFTLLPVGHYSVSVKATGFEASINKDLSVEAGDRARNDVHLVTGASTTTVEVQATTPLLQADSATVSSTVTAKAVQDLPLNGRNFVQLVQLVPGANEGPGNGLTSGGRPDDRRQTASFSVNGQDDTLHNDTFDARNVLQTSGSKPELRQNQFGGSLGGPIWKNRTFFFGDYEGFREVNGLTYTKTTLTQNEYNDVNSLNGGSPQLLLNAGNGTQAQAVDPIALAYLKLYPAPNAGAAGGLSNNYITSPQRTQFSNSFDVRVDHKFNEHNLFFARYDYHKVNTFTPPGF